MAINITVQAESRYAKSAPAYNDEVKHGYNPSYVHPQTRRITLEVSRTTPLPNGAKALEWRVVRRSDGRVFTKSAPLPLGPVDRTPSIGFNLPSEGAYDCQLIVTLGGGLQMKSAVKPITLRDLVVVVIGDSAAAGQGNPDKAGKPKQFGDDIDGWDLLNPITWADSLRDAFGNWLKKTFTTLSRAADAKVAMNPAPAWLESNAYRSMRSGAVMGARELERLSRGDVVTLLHFARSGSDILAGMLGPRTKDGKRIDAWIGNIGQIAEVKRTVGRRQIDALIISIGVNDVGFSGSLKNLVKEDLGWGKDTKNRKAVLEKIDRDIAGLDARFEKLRNALKELDVRHVFITEYPTAIFDRVIDGKVVAAGGCGIFDSSFDMDLTPQDAKDLKAAAGKLNAKLAAMAKRHNWIYIGGIATEFSGHGYCTGKERFFVTAEESLAIQGDTEGTMHPNAAGHRVIAAQLSKALRTRLHSTKIVVPKPGGVVVSAEAGTTEEHEGERWVAAETEPSPV